MAGSQGTWLRGMGNAKAIYKGEPYNASPEHIQEEESDEGGD